MFLKFKKKPLTQIVYIYSPKWTVNFQIKMILLVQMVYAHLYSYIYKFVKKNFFFVCITNVYFSGRSVRFDMWSGFYIYHWIWRAETTSRKFNFLHKFVCNLQFFNYQCITFVSK